MGWNCNNCGHLLKPDAARTDMVRALWNAGEVFSFLPKRKPKVYSCDNCGARFVVIEGEPPRIYLMSVMVCIDDGEEKKEG